MSSRRGILYLSDRNCFSPILKLRTRLMVRFYLAIHSLLYRFICASTSFCKNCTRFCRYIGENGALFSNSDNDLITIQINSRRGRYHILHSEWSEKTYDGFTMTCIFVVCSTLKIFEILASNAYKKNWSGQF